MSTRTLNGFVIERGIPLPPASRFPAAGITAAMITMKPGESILVPTWKVTSEASEIRRKLLAIRPDVIFPARKTPEGIRLFCIARKHT